MLDTFCAGIFGYPVGLNLIWVLLVAKLRTIDRIPNSDPRLTGVDVFMDDRIYKSS